MNSELKADVLVMTAFNATCSRPLAVMDCFASYLVVSR